MEINLEVFKKNYLVVGLSDDDIKRVAALAEHRVARGGTEIVTLGRRDPDLFVVLDGIAQVMASGGVLLGERGAGSVIGEISLVDGQPRSAYVVAKGTLSYAFLDGLKLRRFMFDNRDIGFIMICNLARVLSSRVREASTTIEDLQGQLSDPWIYPE